MLSKKGLLSVLLALVLSSSTMLQVFAADMQPPSESVITSDSALSMRVGDTLKLSAAAGAVWSSDDIAVAAVGNDGSVAAIGKGTAIVKAKDSEGTVLAEYGVTVDPVGDVNVALGKYVVSHATGNNPTKPPAPDGALSEQNVTNGKIVPNELRGAAGNQDDTITEVAGSLWWDMNIERNTARWLVVDLGEEYEISKWDVVRAFAHNNDDPKWVGPAGFEVLYFVGDDSDKPAGNDQAALRAWWNTYIENNAALDGDTNVNWVLAGTAVNLNNNIPDKPANLNADLTVSQSFTPVTARYFMLRIVNPDHSSTRGATTKAQARVNEIRLYAKADDSKPVWEVTGVQMLQDMQVKEGTELSALVLPDRVSVTLNGNVSVNVPVTWNTATYDGNTLGNYQLEGTLSIPDSLTYPDGIGNPHNLNTSIIVTVLAADSDATDTDAKYYESDWNEISTLLDQFKGIYTSPPQASREYNDRQPDGSLMGNSTLFALLQGTQDVQRIHLNHADMWEREASNQRVGYSPLGSIQIERTDSGTETATFRHEQDMKNAEVMGRSHRGFRTDSWVSAKENVLMTEITNETSETMTLDVKVVAVKSKQAPTKTVTSASVDTDNQIMYAGKKSTFATTSPLAKYNVDNTFFVDFTIATKLINKSATMTNLNDNTNKLTITLAPGESVQMVTDVEGGRGKDSKPIATAKALSFSTSADVQQAKEAHIAWWKNYWMESYVKLDTSITTGTKAAMWERVYLGELYRLGASIEAQSDNPAEALQSGFPWTASKSVSGGTPSTVFTDPAGHVYGDTFRGRYYMNTDIMRPAHAAVISNRLNHNDTYSRVISDFWYTRGKDNAQSVSFLNGVITTEAGVPKRPDFTQGLPGAAFNTNISPWAMDGNSHHSTVSHATMGLQPMIKYYNATLDDVYLNNTLYQMVSDEADFWSGYAYKNPVTGKYDIYGATNEDNYAYPNAILDMLAAQFILNNAINYSVYLNKDADRRAVWQEVLDNMAPYPTFNGVSAGIDTKGKTVFSPDEVTGLTKIKNGGANPAPVQGFYMFDLIGLDSPPEMLEYGHNYLDIVQSWGNDKAYRAGVFAARVSYPPEKFLGNLMDQRIDKSFGDWDGIRPNNATGDYGAAVLLAVVNDSLLHSHEGYINVFPSWYKDQEVSFKNLRAYGAFLVSAKQNASGKVEWAAITSEKGRPATFLSPWDKGVIVTKEDGTIVPTDVSTTKYSGKLLFTFDTVAGETYLLHESATPVDNVDSVKITADLEMGIGTTQTVTAAVSPEGLKTNTVRWSSSNEAIATVVSDGNGNGIVTAKIPGVVTIKAEALADPSISDDIVIEVKTVPATGINILYGGSMALNESRQLFVDYTPAGTDQRDITWTSSDTNVAIVTSDGIVKGMQPGTATISAAVTENPSVKDEIDITVRKDNSHALNYTTGTVTEGSVSKANIAGYEFIVNNAITITAIGIYDSSRNGKFDNNDTPVAVYTVLDENWEGGEPVTEAVVKKGSVAYKGVNYAPLKNPVVLQPGQYVIAGYYPAGSVDKWVSTANESFTTGSQIDYVKGLRMEDSGETPVTHLEYPWSSIDNANYMNVNFQYVDKNELAAYFTQVRDTQKGNYADDVWSQFVDVRDQANAILNNLSADQEDVDNAFEALEDAFAGLEGKLPLRIRLDRDSISLKRGMMEKLNAITLHQNIVWTSSDVEVAVVGNDGTIAAVGSGTAVITATIAGTTVSASSEVTVSLVSSGTNVALNRPASAITAISTGNNGSAARIVDGKTSPAGKLDSAWNSANTPKGTPLWIAIDLGDEYTIGRWVVKHYNPTSSSHSDVANITKDFELQYKNAAEEWVPADSVTGNVGYENRVTERLLATPVTASEFRLYITKPDNYEGQYANYMARIDEVELYTVDLGEDWEVTAVNATASTEVVKGTAVQELVLPETVSVTLNDSVNVNVPVIWDTTAYNGSEVGVYTLEGVLNLPAGISNTSLHKASISVSVVDSANKSELLALYNANKDKVQGGYTDESWEAFTDALVAAKDVLDHPNATQVQVNTVMDALQSAIDGLIKNPVLVADTPTASLRGGSYNGTQNVSLSTTTAEADIYYTLDGTSPMAASTRYTGAITIPIGNTTLKAIAVKKGYADSSIMTEYYTISSSGGNSDASLSDLKVDGNTVSGFNADTTKYTLNVPNSKISVEVTASAADPNADVKVDGGSNLVVGSNTVTITVTAENGTEKVYTITVIRAAASNPGTGGGDPTPANDNTHNFPAGQAGTAQFADKAVTITLPAGATEKELKITVEKVLNTSQLVTDKDVLLSPVYEVLKNFAENFKKPVTLTLTFDPKSIGANQIASIFFYDEAKKVWVEIGGKASDNQITAEVDHFTKFAVFAVDKKVEEKPETKPEENVEVKFSDILGHWAESSIKLAVAKGIVRGYADGTFKPKGEITRAEFAVMLTRMLDLQGSGAALEFTDKASIEAWAKEEIAQAVQAGIVKGYSDGSFRPNAKISRAEMVTMIANALGFANNSKVKTVFADDGEIPAWARAAVAAAVDNGIVQGVSNNKFAPNQTATRAEAAVVLLRALEFAGK